MKKYAFLFPLFLLCKSLVSQNTGALRTGAEPGMGSKDEFFHLSVEQGLSSNTVNSVLEDHHGFLWVATADGLNRYDGKKFVVFRNNPEDSTSLSANNVTRLYEDENHTIWAGTYDGGLNAYDHNTGKFRRYLHVAKDSNSISSNYVSSIVPAPHGKLWVGTAGGLDLFDPKTGKSSEVKIKENGVVLNDLFVNNLFLDKKGFLWIAMGPGEHSAIQYAPSTGVAVFIKNKPSFPTALLKSQVYSFAEDKQANIWIGTGEGLLKYVPDRDTLYFYKHAASANSISGNFCNGLLCDASGKLWIATTTGLTIFYPEQNRFVQYFSDPSDSKSLSNNSLLSVFEGSNQIVWVGGWGGLNYAHPYSGKFKVYQHDPANKYSISNNVQRNIIEDHEHNIWIATESGVNKLDPGTGKFICYSNLKGNQSNTPYIAWALHEDKEGNIWTGTWGNGLQKLNPHTGVFEGYYYDSTDVASLSNNMVISIVEDDNSRLWLATWGGGVCSFDMHTRKFHRYAVDTSNNKVRSEAVYLTLKDSKGNIWVGSGNGLQRYRKATDDFELIDLDPKRKFRFSKNIGALCEAKNGMLWIGTLSGVFRYNPNTKRIAHYTDKNGLPGLVTTGILEDDHGNIWIGTTSGLAKLGKEAGSLSPDSLKNGFEGNHDLFKKYFTADGLPTNNFSGASALKTSDGTLYFGTVAGLVSFHPDEVRENKTPPPVYITSIKILNQDLKTDSDIADMKELTLHYKDKTVSFELAALNYIQQEKNQFAFKLQNFDKDWQYAGDRNFVSYTNLPAGDYILRVKAANNDGVWNEQGVSLVIHVIPPFWMTGWFYLLCAVAIIAGVIVFVRLRLRNLQLQKKTLEETVEKRTHELREEKEYAEAQKIRAERSEKFKEQFLANMSHELRTPMNAVLGMRSEERRVG